MTKIISYPNSKPKSLKIDWHEPLNFAEKITQNYDQDSWAFLYSGLNSNVKNSHSYIGLWPQEKIICDDFFAAEKIIKKDHRKWIGYLSYEVGEQFEKLSNNPPSFINLPKIWLINFAVILQFNHSKRILKVFYCDKNYLEKIKHLTSPILQKPTSLPYATTIQSNFSDQSYLAAIEDIRQKIAAGEIYQTNLTRKFFGELNKKTDDKEAFALFCKLTELSSANYSSFLKLEKNYIISSSPELFLSAKNGKIISRPIKGTTARSQDPQQDLQNKMILRNSAKERAENLMIVDLVRNDISRICQAGSVMVRKLFAITSYKNIHHMSSEIYGKIADNFCAIDALQNCFPAGSMTGAPKIKAMEIAAEKEQLNRGVYSGTIGIFSRDEINSSVVIRTLITNGNKFEFQVGGGITFDSNPKSELEETFNKARGIMNLLNIKL